MSDNRKYYYLKLKENYFDDDSIVLLESMQDGVLYSNILLKLYLKSLKHGGRLQLDEDIPYTAQMIATITRQQIGTVERALQIFLKLGLVEVLDSGTFYMSNIELLIGQSSTEAERKRAARLQNKALSAPRTNGGHLSDMKRKGQIIVGLALILIFILMALAAPLLAPNDPNATDLALKNAPPSSEYPLGCDQMGRCELSRLLYGARYSMGLTIPVLIVLAAFALFVGCYSSYKGGLVDEVMRILCDILMAFPLIVIAMALVSAVDNSVASVIIAIGISMLAWFLRMVRSYAKTECGKEYIEAARISGASGLRIVLRHLIPNVFPQFVVYFTTGIATAIMSVSSFAFLGVGLIAGTPEWGAMLNEARNSVYSNPALLIYPGICLIVCCAGFNLLGEGLRDAIGKEDDIRVA